ncbi:hypothetical protein AB6A40_000786 [Gnathostoma spinigerum]|uniref:Uncharacterized protein n=1 Tax=Gnathostoma spinigerum TaxID=75299 RepID=A0ABD6EC54_9BILA
MFSEVFLFVLYFLFAAITEVKPGGTQSDRCDPEDSVACNQECQNKHLCKAGICKIVDKSVPQCTCRTCLIGSDAAAGEHGMDRSMIR